MSTHRSWSWPIIGYMYLGGLGGGAILAATVADLFFGRGDLFALGVLVGCVALGLGALLLVAELGRPLQAWRVFSRQKAIMTTGAWMLSALIVVSFAYFTFFVDLLPWASFVVVRKVLAALCLLLCLDVCTYTGILLGASRARRFWATPALPALFMLSAFATGASLQILLLGLWPYAGDAAAVAPVRGVLGMILAGLLVATALVLVFYLEMMRSMLGEAAGRAARRWLSGAFAGWFWGGLVVAGLALPIVALLLGWPIPAALLVLAGGVVLRALVLFSDDREYLPGEEKYLSRLPAGDEAFLTHRPQSL